MVYAIISDIHSNLEAFEAVLERIDCLGIKEAICLGDIVGYSANPNECVEIVRSRNIKCVLGNHDLTVAGLAEPFNFNDTARDAVYWTRRHISRDNLLFLKNLPGSVTFNNGESAAVHGFINDSERYILTGRDAHENFKLMKTEFMYAKICFFGHTHIPITFEYKHEKKDLKVNLAKEIALDDAGLYLVNPGAVGQPRNGNIMASFVLYAPEERHIEFVRVGYDVVKTADKILNAGLPSVLAQRIRAGY